MKRPLHSVIVMSILGIMLGVGLSELHAQRRPVTTHPEECDGGKKTETKVDKTPWKLGGLGFITSRNTPYDSTEIWDAMRVVDLACGGDVMNNLDKAFEKGMSTTENTFVEFFYYTRTVTVTTITLGCVKGVWKEIDRDVKSFTEKSPVMQWGPLTWVGYTPVKLRKLIETEMAKLAP